MHFNLKQTTEFVWYRALAELSADAARGFMGLGWWIVEPLLYLGTFYLVFGLVFDQRGEGYVSFLLCGLVIWKWFDSSIRNGSASILVNMPLIYQVYVPKVVFPLVVLVASTVRFAFVFILLLLFIAASNANVADGWYLYLPLLLAIQFLAMAGIAMILAAVVPFVPDIRFLIDNGLTLLFFVSGVFFRFDSIPVSLEPFFALNPIGLLIHSYRLVLTAGQPPDWVGLLPVYITIIVCNALGLYLLTRWNRLYAKKAFL